MKFSVTEYRYCEMSYAICKNIRKDIKFQPQPVFNETAAPGQKRKWTEGMIT